MNSTATERVLLKQITDLTRQLKAQKNHPASSNGSQHLYIRPTAGPQPIAGKLYGTLPKPSRKWCRAAIPRVPEESPGTPVEKDTTCSRKPQTSAGAGTVLNTAGNEKPKQVFVNPNFVPRSQLQLSNVHVNPKRAVLPSGNVHINPKFRSTVDRAQGNVSPMSMLSNQPPQKATQMTSNVSNGVDIPTCSNASIPTSRPAEGKRRPSLSISTTSDPVAAASAVLSPAAAARRRSRSLSSRYRLLTARKLIRRLSHEKQSPALQRTRHKLVTATGSTASTTRPKTTAAPSHRNRFKLVRNHPTPSQNKSSPSAGQLRPAALTPRKPVPGRSGQVVHKSPRSQHRTLKRCQPPAARSQHRVLKRTQTADAARTPSAAVAVVHSRVWRRRSSSGSGQRLLSTGVVKLGSDRFVNIGGLLYKSTRRKLQRASELSQSAAARTNRAAQLSSPRAITVRGTRYRVEAGGRTLRRLSSSDVTAPLTSRRLHIGGVTYSSGADGHLSLDARQQTNRAVLSRAKARSLAVLRLRLSRHPCRLYCRTGRCLRHQRHLCPHRHDPTLRPVCTRHLAPGGCQRAGCGYNHEPAQLKLPMCLHFLADECRREACPYLHVYVDPEAPLCAKFLAGYCPDGQNCRNKHLYICPEFSAGKPCPRGSSCPLLHRARRRRVARRSPATAAPAPPRGGSRYYLSVPEKQEQTADTEEEPASENGEQGVMPIRKNMAEMPSFIALDSSSEEEI